VRKQYKRNHGLWTAKDENLPVIGSIASKFNDEGINHLFGQLLLKLEEKKGVNFGSYGFTATAKFSKPIIPPARIRYLSEIYAAVNNYNAWVNEQADVASKLGQVVGLLQEEAIGSQEALLSVKEKYE